MKTKGKKKAAAKTYDFEIVKGRRVYAKDVQRELTATLGPVKRVVRMSPAKGTEMSKTLHLECGHKRVGTPRATLRCRRCAK